MDDQDRRNVVLKELMILRRLVQMETLADPMTHEACELKDLSQACAMKLADILQIFDNLIDKRVHQYSPAMQKCIAEDRKRRAANEHKSN